MQVDGALDVYSRERRGQPGSIELTPRGAGATGESTAPESTGHPAAFFARCAAANSTGRPSLIDKGQISMNARVAQFPPVSSLVYLSRLLLQPPAGDLPLSLAALSLDAEALKLSRDEFDDVLSFAHSNHVVVRGLERLLTLARVEQERRLVSGGGERAFV